ncbi:MAG: 5'/3'-nucleotidase SurE [Candidatus Melainabacteria bacterium]|nr:MAG: 5'/3'-nucleotidase SurE [Candidatus Melainabacteria bacterium]
MKILMSNDDGISANGIKVLSETLAEEHDVYIVAPDRERSAAGHSLTLHTPLRVEELETRNGIKRRWVTTGTPGDCVKIGISAILSEEEKPDLVISGINHGPNLASDILYSGTVSCAMEGAMLGIPSMAVSLVGLRYDVEDFKFAAQFVKSLLPKLKNFQFPKKTILNINVPALPPEDIVGISVAQLGDKTYTNTYEKRIDPRGKVYYWLAGELIQNSDEVETDIAAVRNNRISITPISYDMTRQSLIKELDGLLCANGNCNWY